MQYRAKETPTQSNTVSAINTTLEVVSGSPNNHHTKESVFDTIPLHSNYYVLPGRTTLARFNTVLHHAYGKLEIPGPRDIVTITGKAELHLDTGKYTGVEVASCAFLSNLDLTANPLDTSK